jgi:hypothetical protein
MRIAELRHKMTRFGELGRADQWLLLRATAWLAVARMLLVVMPFRRLSAPLSAENDFAEAKPDPELLDSIGRAVGIAANNVPWRSDCFPQTIAARMLLRRAGVASTIHFGVERIGDDVLTGHAWLTCGDTVVTGGGDLHRYTELHTADT